MKRPLSNDFAKKHRPGFFSQIKHRDFHHQRNNGQKDGPDTGKFSSKNGQFHQNKTNFNGKQQNGHHHHHHHHHHHNHHHGQRQQNGFHHKSNENSSGNDSDANDTITQQRRSLPIYSVRQGLINSIEEHPSAIFIGETGCGKTTQIPQFALEIKMARNNPNFRIAITQPRRVAAISIANRVAKELGCDLGEQVGYSVRFDEKSSTRTRIKFVTDGMLLRESLSDRLLKRYSLIILDEAHERSIQTDILFTVVKEAQRARIETPHPLKVLIMSATMNVDKFSQFFNNAPVFYLEGRLFPIKIFNSLKAESDYQHAALVTVFQIHQNEPEGDILVFCTGQEEIESMLSTTRTTAKCLPFGCSKLIAFPLYAALPSQMQMKVFDSTPPGTRKVIFSTNIAETSITIPGIKYVVDTGKVKARSIRSNSGVELLQVENISKSQAQQRAGRAGRESSGVCYRLYTQEHFDKLAQFSTPEILRVNLANVLLHLSALNIKNYYSFEFMDKPNPAHITKSANLLESLGAVKKTEKEEYELTDLGKQMIVFPVEPKQSKMLIMASKMGCLEEILTIISLLYVDSVFHFPAEKKQISAEIFKKFASNEGDHIFLLNVYKAYKAVNGSKNWCQENFINMRNMKTVIEVRRQLSDLCRKSQFELRSAGENTELVRECLALALFCNVAHLQKKGFYKTSATSEEVHIHPSSCLHSLKPDCVVFSELTQTSKCYIRQLSVVKPEWITSDQDLN